MGEVGRGGRIGAYRLIQLLRQLISIDVIVRRDGAVSLAVDRWTESGETAPAPCHTARPHRACHGNSMPPTRLPGRIDAN